MKKEQKIAISVLAIALTYGLYITGIVPVLGMLSQKYAGYSTSTIQLMQTIPCATLMLGSTMIGWLTTKYSKKTIVLAGLVYIGVWGILPFLIDNFYILFMSRILIGYGFGIIAPAETAIITEFFDPGERAGYMGLHVVGMGIGAMIGNILGSNLAKTGLRYFYLVYLMAFLGVLVIQALLPKTPPVQAEKSSDLKLNHMIYVLSIIGFLHALFIYAYSTNISIYITQTVTEDPAVSGIATAVNAVFALCMGLCFTKIINILKKATLPFSILAACVGYACLLMLPGMAGVMIASALCGVSLSCFSAMSAYLISLFVETDAVAKAGGFFSLLNNVGGLIAPFVLGACASVMGGNTPVNQFRAALAGMLILGGFVSVFMSRTTEGNE